MTIIGEFKSNKSPGADCIGPKFLKEISNLIISPLTHIFNLCFASGLVPDSLKLAIITHYYWHIIYEAMVYCYSTIWSSVVEIYHHDGILGFFS